MTFYRGDFFASIRVIRGHLLCDSFGIRHSSFIILISLCPFVSIRG